MIKGIGADLCDMRRIEKTVAEFGDKFINRILTPEERAQSTEVSYIAKRFAAKEAVSKALGVGIGMQIGFQDIQVLRQENAPASVELLGEVSSLLQGGHLHISLTDEKDYAQAFVVWEIL